MQIAFFGVFKNIVQNLIVYDKGKRVKTVKNVNTSKMLMGGLCSLKKWFSPKEH